ncbi:cysteine protease StiP domain-containing protein [Deinococcus sp.]|uniref:cysteine protease StiP domain-containing protein n=1 Tax=Deinococcus sp. TaxID=47478 RepID=UPI0025CD82F6|nr:cysteine protease StiP domain-containing protein [Deinococcus sp.]
MPVIEGHTWRPEDVTLHLAPARPRLVGRAEKEALIASGTSYGFLLERESEPSDVQEQAYADSLARSGERLGIQLASLAAHLAASGQPVTLLSLPRGGLPVGAVLLRLLRRAGTDTEHHAISVIRGVGLDLGALDTVLASRLVASLVFVDGWTGKGSVRATLRSSLSGHPAQGTPLLVLSDPANVAELAATREDQLLPHAALNATVSGLLSRTFLVPGQTAHAALAWTHLAHLDRTPAYLDALEAAALAARPGPLAPRLSFGPLPEALRLAAPYSGHDPHKIKPSVGEATRVFLRRIPSALLVRDASDPEVAHLLALAAGEHVPVHVVPALPYRALAVAR